MLAVQNNAILLGLSWVTLAVSGIGMCAAWNTGASGRLLWQTSVALPGSSRLSVLWTHDRRRERRWIRPVCSFSGKAPRQLELLFYRSFSPPVTPSSICVICCPCTGLRVPCQGQLDKTSHVGWAESRAGAQMGWTWVAVRGFCAEPCLIFAIVSGAHCRTFRAHSTGCLAKISRRI